LLNEIPWIDKVDKATRERLFAACHSKIYSPGQTILKAGKVNQGLFIISRGTVRLMKGAQTKALLGKGDILGELILFTGKPGTHSAEAESPVTLLRLNNDNALKLITESPKFAGLLRNMAYVKLAENAMAVDERFAGMDRKQILKVSEEGKTVQAEKEARLHIESDKLFVLCEGLCSSSKNPDLQYHVGDIIAESEIVATEDSVLWVTTLPA
jgi:CRP-like cAMP-binding protein